MLFQFLKPTIVLWMSSDNWNRDSLRELFPPPFIHYFSVDYYKLTQNMSLPPIGVVIYNIENCGPDAKYQSVRDMISNHSKISILVHNSDEWENSSKRRWKYGEGTDLYNLVPLVIREYGIFQYRCKNNPYANVLQLPLGYMTGMFDFNDTLGARKQAAIEMVKYSVLRTSAQREFLWSFVGTVYGHKERPEMLAIFETWNPFLNTNHISPQQMREVYLNSTFVLVGRGLVNLDCYRIYESIICGAIPVIVGSQKETDLTFEFEGNKPPLLYADNYTSALQICQSMSADDIDEKRKNVISWYVNRIDQIQGKIELTLRIYS
jgi:hypothetical protein